MQVHPWLCNDGVVSLLLLLYIGKKRRADDELLQYKQRSEERLHQQHTDICAQLDNMEADWKVLHSLVARMVTVMEDQAKKWLDAFVFF